MGYTEIYFRGEISDTAFDLVHAVLNDDPIKKDLMSKEDHIVFKENDPYHLFSGWCDYFPGNTDRSNKIHLQKDERIEGDRNIFRFSSSVNNWYHTIESFFDWIAPHLIYDAYPTKPLIFMGYSVEEEFPVPNIYYAQHDNDTGLLSAKVEKATESRKLNLRTALRKELF